MRNFYLTQGLVEILLNLELIMSLLLQDLVHCEKHCMALADPDDWVCGLKKHSDVCTQGCYFGSTGFSKDFEIEEDDFFKLPDPDSFDKDEYCYTIYFRRFYKM